MNNTISRVPGDQAIFILGCLERRVTIYAQQVRAIELARHLLEDRIVRPAGCIAIVGAGIGGLTLASMLAVAAPNLRIVVFEAHDQVLRIQAAARDRFVHPHIFDWPADHAAESRAGLPLMDWCAGNADQVALALLSQFDAARKIGSVELQTNAKVEGLRARGDDVQVLLERTGIVPLPFDAAVLSIGFGYERLTSLRNPSYWSPSVLAGPFLPQGAGYQVFISGNGDGGLADFALAAFNGLSHETVLQTVLQHLDTPSIKPLLAALDEKAWADPDFDLFEAYSAQLSPQIKGHLLRDVRDMLRPDAKVVLHTEGPHLFRANTALLNRFVAFLAIHADRHDARNNITIIRGGKLADVVQHSDVIKLANGRTFTPNLRLLRFGPDGPKAQAPFDQEFKRFAAKHKRDESERPSDPMLRKETRLWAEQAVRDAGLRPSAIKVSSGAEEALQSAGPASAASQINVVNGDIGANTSVTQIFSGR